ncbi:MAG: hypothetical protein QOI58_133 [Thermoanaerobaculia bacterium]|jgi:hypothetical protein|nr:hypothetical protein [Thermoanaerobaculia bacterium]
MNGIVKPVAANEPQANLKVTLHDAISGQSVETFTDSSGAFSFEDDSSDQHFFYVSTMPADEIILTAILGATIPATFVINELTTVAACYSAAQFITAGMVIEGSPFALSIVAAMNANLVDVTTGMPSAVMTSSPNGDETNACRSLMSLANVVAAWVNHPVEFHAILAKLATLNGAKPNDTIEAMVSIAKNPAKGVGAIYAQSKVLPVFQPALERQPDAWTIVVKVNDSGDDANMFGGPGNVAFDSQGRAWIANNVQQGSGISTAYSIVLDMSGRPVKFSNGNGSPITGGGLLGPGFGVDVDSQDRAWFGDFGWGGDDYWPLGSVSAFDANAKALSSAPDGYTTGGVRRVQGTVVDDDDNVWFASYGTGNGDGNVVVYLKPDPNVTPFSFASYAAGPIATPFDIAIAADGSAWMTNSNPASSGIVHLQLNGTETLTSSPQIDIGQTTKGIQIDSAGNIWVASGGDDHVYVFDSAGNFLGGFQGGGIDGPWGITLDGDDNLWVANFGPLEPGSNFHGRLTQLAGINATGHRLGDGLTPQTGYTLPSAGCPVTLHNGDPLYGPGKPPSHIPMMRTTGVNIDPAGNVWTCNNWKPNFDNDTVGGNPGGDGMLIWVGLAKPRGGRFGDDDWSRSP